MDNALWNKINQFDLDYPVSEYGFSVRLAYENRWTINFTRNAITEYKKFMYLAVNSDLMVSPSEIVDIVWHQHLIFTESYSEFCKVLGKVINHIPSTHDKAEREKFARAKERTTRLYESVFGKQPDEYWNKATMVDSLNMGISRFNIRNIVVVGIFVLIGITIPLIGFLYPYFSKIDNPYFLTGYVFLILVTFVLLEIFNRQSLKTLLYNHVDNPVLSNLTPSELVLMNTGKPENVIHGYVNQLVLDNTLLIAPDNTITVQNDKQPSDAVDKAIIDEIDDVSKMPYPYLIKKLMAKKVFLQMSNSILDISKYFKSSVEFIKIFVFNYCILIGLFVPGFVRFCIGAYYDKPIIYILGTIVVLLKFSIDYLKRTTNLFFKRTIPKSYIDAIKDSKIDTDKYESWDWQYFIIGTAFSTSSFTPLVNYIEKNGSGGNTGSCGSSCGSSCGGGGCGGCGGGD